MSERRFPNRSQAVESALAEKLGRLARTRLATECAKLDERSGTVIAAALTSQEPRAGFSLTLQLSTPGLPKRSCWW